MRDLPPHRPLLPETPILVYPSLAATIGLEEATLLSALTQQARCTPHDDGGWWTLSRSDLAQLLPFFSTADIARVAANLAAQGLLFTQPGRIAVSGGLRFCLEAPRVPEPPAPAANAGKRPLERAWQPDADALAQLEQLGVPLEFAREQVLDFVLYWRERGDTAHAWNTKFVQRVLRQWRELEAASAARARTIAMPRNWRPSEDALDVLTRHAGINRQFVEDAIPEFVLYWREQGAVSDNWNKKFRDHVQRQWARFQAAVEHDTLPRRLPEHWQPSPEVFDVLHLANIDAAFARQLVPEFALYWRDSNQVHSSWNTKFLQFVKLRWAQRGASDSAKSTREISLAEQLTDRSWAS